MKRFWIKLYVELLDDPKMGSMPDFLWRRAIELFLAAGENGNDGLLQPVAQLAWRLRLPEAKLSETLRALSEVGVVHETPQGWMVTHFAARQAAISSTERARNFRKRERNEDETKRSINRNEVVGVVSTSTSVSVSSERGVQGGKPPKTAPEARILPRTPAEAAEHLDIKVFTAICERMPGISQYAVVIDTVQLMRTRYPDEQAMIVMGKPYWLAWKSRVGRDGQPYDESNLAWFTEWFVNGKIPLMRGNGSKATKPVNYDIDPSVYYLQANPHGKARVGAIAELKAGGRIDLARPYLNQDELEAL